jgi:hypothetical protein
MFPSDNRAMTSLNISDNNIGELVYPNGWYLNPRYASSPNSEYKYKHNDGGKQDEDPGEALVTGRPDGAIALAGGIKNNGALAKLDISKNSLCAAGAKAISEGLKGNQVMTVLNLAGNDMGKESPGMFGKPDISGVTALADVIPAMGAISHLTFSGNDDSQSITMKTTMVVADFSRKALSVSGAIMLSAFLPKCT